MEEEAAGALALLLTALGGLGYDGQARTARFAGYATGFLAGATLAPGGNFGRAEAFLDDLGALAVAVDVLDAVVVNADVGTAPGEVNVELTAPLIDDAAHDGREVDHGYQTTAVIDADMVHVGAQLQSHALGGGVAQARRPVAVLARKDVH